MERAAAEECQGAPGPRGEARPLVIGVIGDGEPDSPREEQAALVGAALAREGVYLVCGGLGGCMAGAARGYRAAGVGGFVLGLLPGTTRDEANRWLDIAIPTGVNSAQGALVAMAVDGAIVIGGGGGTLSEVGLLLRDRKPVVALAGSGGAAELVGGKTLGDSHIPLARTGDEAVQMMLRALRRR